MTPVSQRTGGDRLRTEAKRPPVGAVGRCRCWRTGEVQARSFKGAQP